MDIILNAGNTIMHFDKYITVLAQNYGIWIYALLFLIIFCETGLVVTPFLPGDSILFATGALAALGSLNIVILFVGFYFAAVIGDTINYHIGKKIDSGIIECDEIKFIKKEDVVKAEEFYDKYGPITIVLARFIPIVRTFAPFVAGVGEMKYAKFIFYNMIGGGLWVTLCLALGYFLGNIPIIKQHFSTVLIVIVLVSVIIPIYSLLRAKKNGNSNETGMNAEN
jgi:membrane-associated protein